MENKKYKAQKCLTILHVDDSEQERLIMFAYLKKTFGSSVIILNAQSGEEAISKITTHSVDLIVSDVEMPNGNGLELFKFFENLELSAGFLFFSGAMPIDSSSESFLGFVEKPDYAKAMQKVQHYFLVT